MDEFEAAKRAAHRQNLARYHRLLGTQLTADERHFIERRITEEQTELEQLSPACGAAALRDMLPFGPRALPPVDAASRL
ncbi:MAG: hypothetical protein IT538_13625 [Variibacter sp.]|nr:hypothetical protein [Variibacter sp.]